MTEHNRGVFGWAGQSGLSKAAAPMLVTMLVVMALFSLAIPVAAESTPHVQPGQPGAAGAGPRVPPGGAEIRKDGPAGREEPPRHVPAVPDEKGSGEPYDGGCPYRGKQLELIV